MFKNSIILYIKLIVQILVALYTTRVILNILGVADYGIFNLLSSSVAMFGFIKASLSSSTSRFLIYAEGENKAIKKKEIFNVSFFLHLFFSIVLIVFSELMLQYFFVDVFQIPADRIHTAKQISHVLIIISVLSIVSVPFEAVLNSHENMLYFSLIDISKSFLMLGVAVSIASTSTDKLLFYSIAVLIINLFTLIAYGIYCLVKYKECDLNFGQNFKSGTAKEMLSFSGFEFMGYSSGMISLYSTNILINSFFGTVLNAAQGIANQVSGQISAFSNTMLKAVNPAIIKSKGARKVDFFEKTTLRTGKYSFLILSIFSIPFLINTQFILEFWLKQVPDWAVIFCQFQVVKNLIEQFTISFGIAIGANGKIRNYAIVNTINNIFPLPIIYLLFKMNMPPYVMYLVTIFFFSFVNFLINLHFCKILLGLNPKVIIRSIVIPCTTVFILVFVQSSLLSFYLGNNFTSLICVSFFSTILIVTFTFKLLLENDEKLWITQFVKRGLNFFRS